MPLIIMMEFKNGTVIGADATWSADSLTHPDKSILWVLRAECGCELIDTTFWGCPRHVNAEKATAAHRAAHLPQEA